MTAGTKHTTSCQGAFKSRPFVAILFIIGGLVALVLSLALSISVGAAHIQLSAVWEAVFHFNPGQTQDQIIHDLRMPRALASALVGAAFAVAGALMQGMTRNPLADPGLLGINAGAVFVLALCFAFFPNLSFFDLVMCSFAGAGLGAGLVYGIGSMARGGLTPARLTLSGAAVGALLIALSQGIAFYFGLSQDLAFWVVGGVARSTWLEVRVLFPLVALGLVGALMLSKSITVMSLGEEVATSLGQRTRVVKLLGTLLVLVLAGASVSTVGPIAFVGLVVPHVARYLVGVDYRWIVPCSAVFGSLLMVFSDIGARMIHPPYETPIGAVIALIGVPFFLYLTRKEGGERS
jgi:iron complex transport system permease protein